MHNLHSFADYAFFVSVKAEHIGSNRRRAAPGGSNDVFGHQVAGPGVGRRQFKRRA